MPTMISEIVAITTCSSLCFSMQAAVPKTWLVAPIANPFAISLLILKVFSILCPNMAPNSPVKATIQAVNSGIPPINFDISIAIGAVTDFGINEKINFMSEWNKFPIITAERIAIIEEEKNPTNIALLFFESKCIFLYKGYAKVIVAGPKTSVRKEEYSL